MASIQTPPWRCSHLDRTASQRTLALDYYAPVFFSKIYSQYQQMNYGLNGIFYGVKIFAALAFVLLSADRFGRRATLMVGAPFMAVFHCSPSGERLNERRRDVYLRGYRCFYVLVRNCLQLLLGTIIIYLCQ